MGTLYNPNGSSISIDGKDLEPYFATEMQINKRVRILVYPTTASDPIDLDIVGELARLHAAYHKTITEAAEAGKGQKIRPTTKKIDPWDKIAQFQKVNKIWAQLHIF